MDVVTLLAETVGGEWRPGIGDRTPIAWATVVAYLLASFACWRAYLVERRSGSSEGNALVGSTFWLILAGLMLLLGVNKQLDLQTWFTSTARRMAREQGWYEVRRTYQAAFIGGLSAIGLLTLAVFGWISRAALRRRFLALLGGLFLVVFVVIRAASFHHVDHMLGLRFGALRWNGILELGGISCVGIAAVWSWRGACHLGEPRGGLRSRGSP